MAAVNLDQRCGLSNRHHVSAAVSIDKDGVAVYAGLHTSLHATAVSMAGDQQFVFFNGTVMRGEPDHGNLRNAQFVGPARTARSYRLYSIQDQYPAMVYVPEGGVSVEGELYAVDESMWPAVLDSEPEGLRAEPVELDSGRVVLGMVTSETFARTHGLDISDWGSWRAYQQATRPPDAQPPRGHEQGGSEVSR
jgi:gamma-glutamylaminecyclotransferase